MVGRTLGHYRILRSLGKGGMGEVWAAEDTRLHRKIALKTLPETFAADPERISRFEREAHSIAALNHPNIVTIYSVERVEGERFLTMELVEGRRLSAAIPKKGLPLAELLSLSIQLADALSTAHRSGIIHRDLKPGNIMVTPDGRVKILDFGLAKLRGLQFLATDPSAVTDPVTRSGQVLGTMPYMSPEQIKGDEVDERSDIFSLGLVLHEMGSGRRAFASETSAELSSEILRDDPTPISELRPDLPHHLGRIVSLCLAKEPTRRYQSALDLRNELEVLRGEVEHAVIRPSSLGDEAPRPSPKRRRRRLGWAAAAVALGLLTVLGSQLLRREPNAELELPSLAVLPLDNLTGDANLDYVAEGISAGLITQLGELSGLRVASRSETRRLGDAELPTEEVARRLGVAAVLDGNLQRDRTGLRVGIELSQGLTGEVVWSRTIRGARERLFELQSEIARELTRNLSLAMSREERGRLFNRPTTSDRAWELYLQGQQYLEAVDSPRNAQFAFQVLDQAARLDPGFALAHVGLSEARWRSYQIGKDSAMLQDAEREAQRALEIDPQLPAALVAMARIHRSAGRYAASIAELRPILERHPRPDEAYRELAASYSDVGELDAAERALEAAVALRSDYWAHWNVLGNFLLRQGRHAEAREALEKATELAPAGITWPLENLGSVSMREGDFDGAIEIYERFALDTTDPQTASNLATAYFFSGRLEEAERYYRLAVQLAPDDAGQRGNLGDVLARLGRQDEARAEYGLAYRMQLETLYAFPDNLGLKLFGAVYAAKAGECVEATRLAGELAPELPRIAENVHYLAWVYALCDTRDEAIAAIRSAIELGIPAGFIGQEDEFAGLRDDPEFRRLIGAE